MLPVTDLFNFAFDAGKKLFGKHDDPAQKIRAMLEAEKSMPIRDLTVEFRGGVVTLCGECATADDREKAVLLTGNVQGVARVDADRLKAPAPKAQVKYYVVQKGDSLSKIAGEFYGKPMDYPRIFEANREVIKDPDLIYPGQKLRIPMA